MPPRGSVKKSQANNKAVENKQQVTGVASVETPSDAISTQRGNGAFVGVYPGEPQPGELHHGIAYDPSRPFQHLGIKLDTTEEAAQGCSGQCAHAQAEAEKTASLVEGYAKLQEAHESLLVKCGQQESQYAALELAFSEHLTSADAAEGTEAGQVEERRAAEQNLSERLQAVINKIRGFSKTGNATKLREAQKFLNAEITDLRL